MTNDEISAEASKRICEHMNDDHAVSVYAMAKSLGSFGRFKLTDARLKKVTLLGCSIQAIKCKGDLCEMKPLFYKFDPPLTSSSQVRPRMVEVHQKVCSARLHWLVTKPDAFLIVCLSGLAGYGTWMGVPGMVDAITSVKQLNLGVEKVFGSAQIMAEFVPPVFYVTVVAHLLEATWAAYKCRTTLKLKLPATLIWFLTVTFSGYFILSDLIMLLTVDRVTKEAAAAKKSK